MPPQLWPLLAALAALFIALRFSTWYGRRRLERWCRDHNLELVDWRGARFYEGPRAWIRSEYQSAYHITVRDRDGMERTGYVVFGTYWGRRQSEGTVTWDDE